MITLNSCIQLFWGGGGKKGRGTFILNFLDFEELIRSHSFHGKPDKKEGKYAAIERKLLPDISKLPLSTSRDSVHDSAQLTTNAKENSQQIKDDTDEIDFSFGSDIVSQSSASLNNQADSR